MRWSGSRLTSAWSLLPAFHFLAEQLSVAQPQELLVDAQAVGTVAEFLVGERRPVGNQFFGVDDDLAFAAKILRDEG